MKETDICFLSAIELRNYFLQRKLSPLEVTNAIFDRLDRLQPKLNAFVTVTKGIARKQAIIAETAYREGTEKPLSGIPISIKDLTATKGIRTTMGSLIHQNWVPEFNAPVAERLLAAGAVLLGKTNTPEYGWKGETSNRLVGTTHNPWRYERTPGGSSGGGAAAVAAGLGPLSQGSDGAGSIRIPCSFCGIFGFKPTYGLVPQYPPSAMELLSHIGPMSRTVEDSALMLSTMAGADELDPHSWSAPCDYLTNLKKNGSIDVQPIVWSPNLGTNIVDPEISKITAQAARNFSDIGYQVEEKSPEIDDPWEIINTIWVTALASLYEDRLEESRSQIDPGLLSLIDSADKISGIELATALRNRNKYFQQMRNFMEGYQLLLTPTMPLEPFPAGLDRPTHIGNTQLTPNLSWTPFTYPFNITGQPVATVPCGFTSSGLPVGLQIIGRHHEDSMVLAAAARFQEAYPWDDCHPPTEN